MDQPQHRSRPRAGTPQRSRQPRRPPSALGVEPATEAVLQAWAASDDFTEQTLARASETVLRFTQRLAAQQVCTVEAITTTACSGFIDATTVKGAAPLLTSRHARRTTLRMYFRTLRRLGYPVGDPTLDIDLPVRSATSARPLSDDEIVLCRITARLGEAGTRSLQRAVCWALAEATAVTSEITTIAVKDLDDPRAPRWVQLPGTRRHDPRAGELTDWGATIIARQLEAMTARKLGSDTRLTYRGGAEPGGAKAQASACNAISAVLDVAGLAAQPDVRPASVRNWAGRRLYDSGMPIDRVARRLGARTLDSAAADIALTWRAHQD